MTTKEKDVLKIYENMVTENENSERYPYMIKTYSNEDLVDVKVIYLNYPELDPESDGAPALGSNQTFEYLEDGIYENMIYDFMEAVIYKLVHVDGLTQEEAEELFTENETYLKDYVIASAGSIYSSDMANSVYPE